KLYKTKTCILSVEDMGEGRYGNIRIAAGNKAHADDILKLTGHPFEPGCPYEMCFPKDLNFENFVYRSAICGEPMHSYVSLYQMGLWLNMFMIPLDYTEGNTCYCIYSYDVFVEACHKLPPIFFYVVFEFYAVLSVVVYGGESVVDFAGRKNKTVLLAVCYKHFEKFVLCHNHLLFCR
ncbi:MAG: hypothetical protein II475_00405, partial [Bacteroidales bacterium]|nr:hypothetical protein [Bacteroidales bacterium]